MDLVVEADQLEVSGCLASYFGDCVAPGGERMSVTVDGAAYDVPYAPQPDTGISGFRRVVPAPRDATAAVEVSFAGDQSVLNLPPIFAITPPPLYISRTEFEIVVVHEVLPGASITASLRITCGDMAFDITDLREGVPGELHLVIGPVVPGRCANEVQLTQALPLPRESGFTGTLARSETFSFSTEP